MDIKKDLPNTPEEIIEYWIDPVANREDYGWPPTEYNAWHYLLGKDSSLSYLAGMQWEKKTIPLDPSEIIESDMNAIRDVFQMHVVGVSMSPTISDPEYHDMFRGHIEHLKKQGRFPKPLILEQTDKGLRVLDGIYRLCAFFYLGGYLYYENTEIRGANLDKEQPVWLGTRS